MEEEKSPHESRWSIYYKQHSFEYLKRRVTRRILNGDTIKYKTLVKYDLIGHYLNYCSKEQKAIFEKQQRYYKTTNHPDFIKSKTEKELDF